MPLAPTNPALAATMSPPVMEARRWLAETTLPDGVDLLNVSQAAPVDPPHPDLLAALAETVLHDPAAHLYGPVLGLPDLRAQVAGDWSSAYGGAIADGQVAITAGCNQAFCAALATLAGPGDEVILPTPWYFNHKMWLDMTGVTTIPLACDDHLTPDPDRAAALITDRTRAIVLVSPNNPTGVEYPAVTLRAFYDLAKRHGIALIVDETYRDFDGRSGAAHDLFTDPDWDDTLIHLYSFSKAYRLTGHRVGALITSPARLAQVEKFLDTVTICPNQLGQRAALWGMRNLSQWLAGERAEILSRRAALTVAFDHLPDWRLMGAGAYFGYVEHPFDVDSDALARRMLAEQGVLALPGTMFGPRVRDGGTGLAERSLRIAFANVDAAGIADLAGRLARMT